MKMHSPNLAVTSVSFDGETFDADERGVFDVPEKAAAELQAHGLIPGEPKPATPQAPAAPERPPETPRPRALHVALICAALAAAIRAQLAKG